MFRAVGFDVTPYPVDYRTRGADNLKGISNSIAVGLAVTDLAAHEWFGLIALMSAVKVWNAGGYPIRGTAAHTDDRAWVEAELKDVGDQALMRGLATAFPIVRPGLFLSYCGRRPCCRPQSV